jgi:hypothetical protein
MRVRQETYLSMFCQNARGNFGVFLDQAENGVFSNIRSLGGKVNQGFESGIWFAENTMAIARNNLPRL